MGCRWLSKRLSSGRPLRGNLKTLETDEHLKEFAECRQESKSWEELDRILEQLPTFDPPPGLLEAVMEEVLREEPGSAVGLRRRVGDWWSGTTARLGGALTSEHWSPFINLAASFTAVWLFFTDRGSFSMLDRVISLARSGEKLASLSQLLNNRAVQDLIWSLKVGVVGYYYSFLTLWYN